MNRRGLNQLDYKVLHETGRKVRKGGENLTLNEDTEELNSKLQNLTLKMDVNREITDELKIREDIKHALNLYILDDSLIDEEIRESMSVISELSRNFRHIHVELKQKMDVNEYNEKYPEYETILGQMTDFIKGAKFNLRAVREQNVRLEAENARVLEREEQTRQEMTSLKIKEEFLEVKIDQVENMFDLNTVEDTDEIDDYVTKIDGYINEYFNLYCSLKLCVGDDFEEYRPKFENVTRTLRTSVDRAKIAKRNILSKNQETKQRDAKTAAVSKQIICAENLYSEIDFRCNSFTKKYEVDFDKMSDYQILELVKDKNLDFELNSIVDKITQLALLVPVGGDQVQILLERAKHLRSDVSKIKETFLSELQMNVLERDISESKMKNVSSLKIELPKFSGYNSKMDVFTFKSKFQKLVEPTVQKKYWAEYLKRNYLKEPALILVESESDYSKLWGKLLESFGNSRLLLQNKLSYLDKIGGLWKVKGDENISVALASLINSMNDLSSLASEHNIEGQLYEGGGLEKIMFLIGSHRHRKFREENLSSQLSKKEEWDKLLELLKHELILREKLTLDSKTAKVMGFDLDKRGNQNNHPKKDEKSREYTSNSSSHTETLKCHICDKIDHTIVTTARGNKMVPYYVCEKFVNMSPGERFQNLKNKNLCVGCLLPGAVKGPKHKCFFQNFCCPHASHDKNNKIHVVLCDQHQKDTDNINLLNKFKDKFINNSKVELPEYCKHLYCSSEIEVTSETLKVHSLGHTTESDTQYSGIFQLQTIEIEGINLNLFFDSGCGDMVAKKSAIEKLCGIGRAKQIMPGPLTVSGVGDQKSVCHDGVYNIQLPLIGGGEANISGICMPKVTTDFPVYPLRKVEAFLRKECKIRGGTSLVQKLPKLPEMVGGDTDILIGIKYAKYFPKLIFELDSGLGIYGSVFLSSDGTRGVVSGPHAEFSKAEKAKTGSHFSNSYFLAPVTNYRKLFKAGNEIPLLGCKPALGTYDCDLPRSGQDVTDFVSDNDATVHRDDIWYSDCEDVGIDGMACDVGQYVVRQPPKCVKQFDMMEESGTAITYRCVDCRACPNCKKGVRYEALSIQEEIEQHLIEQSVHVDIALGTTTAKLPFVTNPDVRLIPNEKEALKVYCSQAKKLSNKPEDKAAVIDSEKKLQVLGFVDYVTNLSVDEKAMIESSDVKYFIPWRAVWNPKSVTTPCRLVFDASQATKEGCSLNSLLAKGANSMNKLIEMLIRWTVHKYAFHTDIQKMYNAVRLDKSHWKYQLYLWDDELSVDRRPIRKVIKTLIYGVRSSGNLAECGLRRTAEKCKDEFPKAYDIIMNDMYVDDCLSGGSTWNETLKITDELKIALEKGGFSLKGFTFSGHDPPKNLSYDQESVLVGGLKWFPKGDFIQLNISELNFNRKVRGRKPENRTGVQKIITKRDCVSRVAEVFDPLGRVAPVIGGCKLDISELHRRKLDWDDPIPNELKEIWVENFQLIEDLGNIQFHRALVPEDALNLDIETIDMGDAGENLVCSAIYARFQRRNGDYSCQLVFSRTKVIHDITTPRAELLAALLNSSTGFVVHKSFKKLHKKFWKLTDSQVVLHWLNCTNSALKQWVRSRVVETVRLADRSFWFHVSREHMIADLGTRKGATTNDVDANSPWINGLPWMRGNETDFPLKTVGEIVLSSQEKGKANVERVSVESDDTDSCNVTRYVPKEVGDRYKFSQYLINPNKYRFRTVIRILGLVFLFIKKLNERCCKNRKLTCLENRYFQEGQNVLFCRNGQYVVSMVNKLPNPALNKVVVIHIPEDMLNAARSYYFRKATCEVKQFLDPRKYEDKSVFKDGILYFTGRILPTQKVGKSEFADAMLDLSASTFCVPMTDWKSPIAYAIASETHWYDPDVKHGGIESVLRYCQQTAYIIGGRDLVKTIKKECAKCRILHKNAVRVAMGPVGEHNLKIAPAFYHSQVDLCGPFNAYSPVNKRATLKVWLVVFCCTVTGTVDCRLMADAFILAFACFACRFGYPKLLMPDEGSQLVKGCKDMIITFSDVQHRLHVEYGVEFKTCPVGAHYVHGKVERKIQEIKRSLTKNVGNGRLSVIQWETLSQQIANSINNMPIGLKNKVELLENLDVLTPNRLILGRNNNRNPTEPLTISNDFRRYIERNKDIFDKWFTEWLVSYVPELIEKPKWFVTDRDVCMGDIVLFLKSEQEFDKQYQYGIVSTVILGRDGLIRSVEVEYQNANENFKRHSKRGVRELVVIHPVEEIGIMKELQELANLNA